jgi:hypothetical protein
MGDNSNSTRDPFIYITTLNTQVRDDGVYVRFNTLRMNWVVFEFDAIQKRKL